MQLMNGSFWRKKTDQFVLAAEAIYLIYLAWVVFFAFLDTTTISFIWKSEVLNPVRLILFCLACVSLLFRNGWKKQDILFTVLILAGFGGSWLFFKRRFVLDIGILIVGSKGIDFKKNLKVYLAAGLAAFVLSIVLAQVGVSENLVFVQKRALRSVRYAFGSLYATDFAAHLLFLTTGFALLLWKKRNKYLGILFVLEGFFTFWFCGAFTVTICFGLLCIVYYLGLYFETRDREILKKKLVYLVCVPSVLSLGMVVLSMIYNPEIRWMALLNKFMHGRLKYGRIAFDRYPIRLFSQYVENNGNGGSTTRPDNYFFLDCSYINILFCHGIIMLLAMILIMTVDFYKAWKAQAWLLMGILLIVSIDSIMEHHLADISYNPFLLMIFADMSWMKEKTV